MRHGPCWFLLGWIAIAGCGSNQPPPLRHYSPQEITKLHDLLGHPTAIGDVSSTDEAQVNAVDLEKLGTVLAQPDGLVAALDQLAQEAPDVEISMWQQAEKRVMLPEIEAVLGKSSGAVAGPLRDGQADWHQFGWIQIAFVYGGETKGDTSQNAAAIRLNVRGYKDSQALASPGPSK